MAVSLGVVLCVTVGIGAHALHLSGRTDPATLASMSAHLCSNEELFCESGRPRFHFTPAENWMNDPNGLVFYQGKYHMFFQHTDVKVWARNIYWGHAVSTDMLHWEQLDSTLIPDRGHSTYSGSAVVDLANTSGLGSGGSPPLVAIYTHVSDNHQSSQRIAYSIGPAGNLVAPENGDDIVIPTMDGDKEMARDPKVMWHKDSKQWLLVLWESFGHTGLYSSTDLRTWEKLQDIELPGYECPDFFELEVSSENSSRWVLWYANSNYIVGTFNGKRFEPEGTLQKAEYGTAYASQTFSNEPTKRVVQISWVRWPGQFGGGLLDTELDRLPFTGSMSIPMEMDLVRYEDGTLHVRRSPISEVISLRQNLTSKGIASVQQISGNVLGEENRIETSGGLGLDVQVDLEFKQDSSLELSLQGQLISLSPGTVQVQACSKGKMHMPTEGGNVLKLRILSDRGSLEIFDTIGGSSMAIIHEASQCQSGKWTSEIVLSPSGSVVAHELKVHELGVIGKCKL